VEHLWVSIYTWCKNLIPVYAFIYKKYLLESLNTNAVGEGIFIITF